MVADRPAGSLAAWKATAAYLVLALVMTWPLARGLGRDVAWDLGDSLLNMWILSWDGEQLKAIFSGHVSRIASFFDANIFHPERLTLAYSEHLFAQAVQIFPIYLATGNPILCYNLLFLSTFVLCGLGTFLFVRELTGSTPAAFLAGLLFAFTPYRFVQASHLQVLSVQWMPFALYAFRRYFDTRRRRALAGAVAALVAQNLSCGYYLLYFAPFAGLYVLWEIATRRLWRDRKLWTDLGIGGAAVVACTLPFLVPYKTVRDGQQFSRDISEIVRYSADVYSYFTAFGRNRAWAEVINAFPKGEGELFLGFVPMILAGAACVVWMFPWARGGWTIASAILLTVSAAYTLTALAVLFQRRVNVDVMLFEIRASNITRLLIVALVSGVAAIWLSPRVRAGAADALRRPAAFFIVVAVLAWWLSLGPSPRVYGRTLDLFAPYALLLDYVPGYDGVRVPARLAMVVALSFAVLGGLVIARIQRRAWTAVCVIGVAFLLESHTLPMRVNGTAALTAYATPEARVYRPDRAPAIYQDLAGEPPDSVVLEMPLGQPDYDVRSVYYTTVHWKKLVNGYSGFFPLQYSRLRAILAAHEREGDLAWRALEAAGVTHVIVHEGAYLDDEGLRFSAWLRQHGAAEISRRDRDVMFEMPH